MYERLPADAAPEAVVAAPRDVLRNPAGVKLFGNAGSAALVRCDRLEHASLHRGA